MLHILSLYEQTSNFPQIIEVRKVFSKRSAAVQKNKAIGIAIRTIERNLEKRQKAFPVI